MLSAKKWKGCFIISQLSIAHLEGKSGRNKVGPFASQEVEGREEKMGERRDDMERRGRGTPSSMWSLVTRVTRGEEERREVRDN